MTYVGSCSGAVKVSARDRFALTPHHWQLCGRQRIQPIQRNSGGRLAKISAVLAAAPTSGPIPLAARSARPSQTDCRARAPAPPPPAQRITQSARSQQATALASQAQRAPAALSPMPWNSSISCTSPPTRVSRTCLMMLVRMFLGTKSRDIDGRANEQQT